MFPKKLVSALFDVLAVLLVLKVLLALVMFFWTFLAVPPIPVLPQGIEIGSPQSYVLMLQEIGGNIFAYLVLATVATLAGVSKLKGAKK